MIRALAAAAFGLLATAALADEPAARIAPSLAAHTAEFAPAKVYEPAPGVFSAVGYGIANSIMVVGKTGVVIIDTTDSLEEARKVWAEFAPRAGGKPMVAIIYTHNHNDHISGASAFPLAKGGKVIAQATLLREAAKWNGVAAPSIAARAARMYGVFLPKGTPDGFVSVGIGPFLSAFGGGGSGGFITPNLTFDRELKITLAGEKFVIEHAPGETEDQLFVWMPERRVLFPGDNIYKAFPNLYTIRGTSYRDPVQWAASLDRMRALGADVLVPSHTRPIVGAEAIATTLTDYRDAISFVHDQTVRWMNQGLTPDEIVEKVKLPAHLATDPYLLEHYGTVEWSVRSVFAGYMGWFSGDAAELSRDAPDLRAREITDLAGGPAAALAKAQAAYSEGRWKWAAELATLVRRADPALKPQANALEVKALRQLGFDSVSPNGRNYYLEQAAELAGKAPDWKTIIGARQGGAQAAGLPASAIVATFPVRLNAEKAAQAETALALRLAGEGDWTIRVRRGVAETSTGVAPDARVVLAGTKADLVTAMASPGAMQGALASGELKLEKGGPADLATVLDLFRG
ncbi:MAG: alkyl sulfatase dimerization domain-containing protein [Phenylobacterium sp.]|uniref:alkyl sulfatase dimerization domain-containing protein n=1 Tax=Phenylobacterium sp. TaxID=1871053 RepID=UPI002731A5FA|nr:alkyl sulfatase dimerization domain-containing protein [Phenylobacterium sp.]MDP2011743.1 alkyl sulfatase dimerization domain-containing protein [Phenylobacterium sp.]